MWRGTAPWLWGVAALALAGGALLVRFDVAQRREAFQTDARVAHRLLSQRAVQQEAILGTLVLMSPAVATGTDRPEQRLIALHPQLIEVLRRDGDARWPAPALDAAEARSRSERHAVLAAVDAAAGQFTVLLAGRPSSFALRVDARRMMPTDEWPLRLDGPVHAALAHSSGTIELQPGAAPFEQPRGLTAGFRFAKTLDAPGQPFELQLQRATGPAEWPWWRLAAWTGLCIAVAAALAARRRARQQRERDEALLRIGRVGRLNALGELAGSLAHELNQPLAAVLANAQAARRLLDDEDADVATARHAITQAAAQARRAADVVARLRRQVESPDAPRPREPIALRDAAARVLALLEPDLQRQQVRIELNDAAGPTIAQADPIALEQIVHNLIVNALHALAEVPADERRLVLGVAREAGRATLTVRDTGPGFAPDVLPRLFEPFFTTRAGGLGLGLSLCRTLAQAMDGELVATHAAPRGAEFRLTLPLASP